MFDFIFEYYRLSNYDTRPGAGITLSPNKALGLTSGDERPMYDNSLEYDIEEDDLEDIDIDDATLNSVFKKVFRPVFRIDPKRSDLPTSGMRQGPGMNEIANHTTTVTKGISPGLTYRGGQKGPGFGAQSSATYIRNSPGRKSGTQYGTSRAPIDYESENYLTFDNEEDDPMERSFKKHQIKIKKINSKLSKLDKKENKRKLLDMYR
jgi:hypothetical protein